FLPERHALIRREPPEIRRSALFGRSVFAQRHGVDAEPKSRRRRPIGKDVPQMRIAYVTRGLDAAHAVARIAVIGHDVGRERLREARPAGAAFELGGGVEEWCVTAD